MSWLYTYAFHIAVLFVFLALDLFLNTFFTCRPKEKQLPIKILFILLWEGSCFINYPSVVYSTICTFLLDFTYISLIVLGNLRSKLIIFIKYELYCNIASGVISLIYSLLTVDMLLHESNTVYWEYTYIINYFLIYALLSMYIIHRKLSAFPSGKIYRRYFMTITMISVILLIACSMLLGSTILKQEDLIPLIFFLLLIITFLCISIYRRVITVLEESAHAKVEAEKYALQLDYQKHVEENLKALSTLRHDFKNHLIIIEEYARTGNQEKLESYINSIQQELTPTKLIDTPSGVISSLLNAKNETCKNKGVVLNFTQTFDKVSIDDFHIVTILSNLLDNAITAAAKCENGYISLSISQINSYLEISCNNNHREQIICKNGIYKTTKTNRTIAHGLGISSIRKAVEALHGEINIKHTDDTFEVIILVPNH